MLDHIRPGAFERYHAQNNKVQTNSRTRQMLERRQTKKTSGRLQKIADVVK